MTHARAELSRTKLEVAITVSLGQPENAAHPTAHSLVVFYERVVVKYDQRKPLPAGCLYQAELTM